MIRTKEKKMIGVFEPVDWETPEEAVYLDELDVEGSAKRNGKKNLPFDTDNAPDSVELNVRGAIEKKIHQASLSAQKAYDAVASSIESLSIDGEASEIIQLPESFDKKASVDLSTYRDEHNRAKSEIERLEEDYERFRKDNNIRREAFYPASMIYFSSLVLAILIGETVLNMGFFAAGNDFGLLGGALEALIVSVINLALGGIAGGLVYRQVNHIQSWRKYVFGAGFIFLWVCSIAWNLLVAHYRTALSIDPDNAGTLAYSRFLEGPLDLSQVASWMLFSVGIIATLIVNVKAYKADDAYPGYSRVDKKLKEAREELSELSSSWHEHMEHLHQRYLENLEEKYHTCQERADRLERSHRTIQQQIAILNRFVAAHKQVFESCILTYRQVNKQHRETPTPTYFDSPPEAEFKHDFHPDTVIDKRTQIKERRDEISTELPRIKNELLQIYKDKVEEL